MDENFLQINSAGWLTTAAVIQAISGILMIVITIYAIRWAKRQADEAKKARVLSAYLTFESRLNDENARDDRRYLYEHNLENPVTITPTEREILERVCTTFDTLGVLVREELMYRPLVFKPFYDVIIKCWLQALDFIKFERSPNRKAKTYMQDFEYLYEQAEKYRLGHNFPPVPPIHPPHAGKMSIVPSTKEANENKSVHKTITKMRK